VIFVDTSFWVALRNRRDDHHADAARLLERFQHVPLLTTNHVRGETWTFLNRRAGHASAVGLLDALDASPRLTLHFVNADLEDEALRWLRRHDERPYSLVDATSFATMRSLRTSRALAFDGDFAAAGFEELRI
jgi:uncharacterized protein